MGLENARTVSDGVRWVWADKLETRKAGARIAKSILGRINDLDDNIQTILSLEPNIKLKRAPKKAARFIKYNQSNLVGPFISVLAHTHVVSVTVLCRPNTAL